MNLKTPRRDRSAGNLSPVFNAVKDLLDQLSHLVESQPDIAIATEHQPVTATKDPQPSPLATVNQAAPIMNRTPSAIRHMIFQAEAGALLSDPAIDKGFLACIVRPPRTRRVFLHRERLLALVESWTSTQKTNQAKE